MVYRNLGNAYQSLGKYKEATEYQKMQFNIALSQKMYFIHWESIKRQLKIMKVVSVFYWVDKEGYIQGSLYELTKCLSVIRNIP